MNINWYPGHMKKAADGIREQLKLVDLCCEIVDARIPKSSSNVMLEKLTAEKPRLIILSKQDMADPAETKRWIAFLTQKGQKAIAMNVLTDQKTKLIYETARALVAENMEKRRQKDITNEELRMLVFGIPNSGKSTFINNLAKRRSAKVGDRPGVTTQRQWIKTDEKLVLLDTPGVLWPKLDETQALHLAYTGAIRDEVLELEEVGFSLIKDLLTLDAAILERRYGVAKEQSALEVMEDIGRKTGALLRGGEIDYRRTAQTVLDDFRKNRMGRISLERVRQK
ncbi:MAG: ribosome biogenesis GTPase YlqF [Ndongobacter sp.]|nr:ribosome biogenesis GTPase YlqF [Ndongobacter sp.]